MTILLLLGLAQCIAAIFLVNFTRNTPIRLSALALIVIAIVATSLFAQINDSLKQCQRESASELNTIRASVVYQHARWPRMLTPSDRASIKTKLHSYAGAHIPIFIRNASRDPADATFADNLAQVLNELQWEAKVSPITVGRWSDFRGQILMRPGTGEDEVTNALAQALRQHGLRVVVAGGSLPDTILVVVCPP